VLVVEQPHQESEHGHNVTILIVCNRIKSKLNTALDWASHVIYELAKTNVLAIMLRSGAFTPAEHLFAS
jgi:hypothetical protein